MHRELRLESLSQLPLSLRKAALAACSANRSTLAVERFLDAVDNASDSQKSKFLPVFYVLLEPTHIPGMDQLETSPEECRLTIDHVLDLLPTLYSIDVPIHLGPDLWTRVWPWVSWIYAHKDHLPPLPITEMQFCVDFVVFVGNFHTEDVGAPYIWNEPGFKCMVARTWTFVLQIKEPNHRSLALMSLCGFLGIMDPSNPANFEEVIEGAGGTAVHLRALVVEFLDVVLYNQSTPMAAPDIYFIRIMLDFMAEAANIETPGDGIHGFRGPFAAALVSSDIARVLAATAHALAEHTRDDVAYTLDQCFFILGRIFVTPSGYRFLPSALSNELLQAFVFSAHLPGQTAKHLDLFLTILPASLVYHGVLSELGKAPCFAMLGLATAFQGSKHLEKWRRFSTLAQQRLALFRYTESKDYVPFKACDNLECSTVDSKDKFRRCSGCLSFYYCSRPCQIIDWRRGGHRDACAAYGSLFLSEQSDLTVRERGFLRALVHEEYSASKAHIYAQQTAALQQDPDAVLFTLFDYSIGAVRITVHAANGASLFAVGLRAYGAEWDDSVARAARSGGRMALDVVRLLDGRAPRHVLVPLRKTRCDVHALLKQMAGELPRSKEEILGMDFDAKLMAKLESADSDAVEAH
ncbi:hypothetical protein DFH09DRAFT_1170001 [Mycena vulgaris]|nr:hypothetical protein DFH09DRAFT_1170001 [Mycena vulgaris]